MTATPIAIIVPTTMPLFLRTTCDLLLRPGSSSFASKSGAAPRSSSLSISSVVTDLVVELSVFDDDGFLVDEEGFAVLESAAGGRIEGIC